MSHRTSEANKAIAAAWNNEKQLVSEGKGTRDWTPEQQKTILDKGKAYDENGRAFEGQHMKSVEKYPVYQGDPGNIQFLTKKEHLEAHNGNWKNPTNWYFDPVTKQITVFSDENYEPCPTIRLSNPIVKFTEDINGEIENKTITIVTRQKSIAHDVDKESEKENRAHTRSKDNDLSKSLLTSPKDKSNKTSFLSQALYCTMDGVKKAGKFVFDHKEEIGALGFVLGSFVINMVSRNGNSSSKAIDGEDEKQIRSNSGFDEDDSSESGLPDSGSDEDEPDEDESDEDESDEDESDDEMTNGNPKSPHKRRGYHGHRWKKNEDGELELTETWISETVIHKEEMDEDSE